jgi:hypothetical protein
MSDSGNAGRTAGTITASVAARLIDVHPRRLQQLVAAGWIERPNRGEYTLVSVVQGYIRFLLDEDRRAAKSAAEARVLDARAREIELRIAREEAKLVPWDETRAFTEAVVHLLLDGVDQLPTLAGLEGDDRRRLEAILGRVRSQVEGELAKAVP